MTNQELEKKISSALSEMVPQNTFEKISEKIVPAPSKERTRINMTEKKTNKIVKFVIPAVAACFLLIAGFSGGTYYNNNFVVDSIIDIDVNPGIEITANKNDKVIEATAVNNEGVEILDGMDLKSTELKVAVNAIIGSMVQNGYVIDEYSSILVTVQNDDTAKAESLRNEIIVDIDNSLKAYNVNAPVINQTLTSFDDAEQFAKDNNISLGKAVFVLGLARKDSSLKPEDLAKMSISELANIVTEKNLDIRDIADYDIGDSIWENIADSIEEVNDDVDDKVNANGTPSANSRITANEAKLIALDHAGIRAENASFIKVELDNDDGTLEYEIEFISGNMEYEYEIDAATGKIVSQDKDRENNRVNTPAKTTAASTKAASAEKTTKKAESATKKAETTTRKSESTTRKPETTTAASLISKDNAKSIALNHAGVNANDARFERIELDNDDGRLEYEVEFKAGGYEYEYEINAKTGKIISHEKEREGGNKPAVTTTKATETTTKKQETATKAPETTTRAPETTTRKPETTTASSVISRDEAKNIALKHAGISASDAHFEKVELDEDDGRLEYEIEFKSGGYEYEYEINAKTGKIISHEKEREDDD